MENHKMPTKTKTNRTTQGLRDILFDEIEELRSGDGDPSKSLAVANLAKQIINTAKVELDFVRVIQAQEATGTPVKLGQMVLGSIARAASAEKNATGH
jgi:hypothetical protein